MSRSMGILLIFGALFLSTQARATDTRIKSLGGDWRYLTVQDEASVTLLPSTLVLFPNMAYMDGGTSLSDQAGPEAGDDTPFQVLGGIHYGIGQNGVLGVIGSSQSTYVGGSSLQWALTGWEQTQDLSTDEYSGSQAIHHADHKGTILYGHRLNKLRLGLVLGFWGDKFERTKPETYQVLRGGTLFSARAGVGVDFGRTNTLDMALGFIYGMYNDDLVPAAATNGQLSTRLKAGSQIGLSFDARSFIEALGGNHLVPYLSMNYSSDSVAWNELIAGAPEAEASAFSIRAGVDLSLEPLENFFVLPGVGLGYGLIGVTSSGEDVRVDQNLTLPYYGVAVDARLTTWFALRFGLNQYLTYQTRENATTEDKDNDVITDLSAGFGLVFEHVDIDMRLNPAFFTNGPHILSGVETGGGMATQFAIKAHW